MFTILFAFVQLRPSFRSVANLECINWTNFCPFNHLQITPVSHTRSYNSLIIIICTFVSIYIIITCNVYVVRFEINGLTVYWKQLQSGYWRERGVYCVLCCWPSRPAFQAWIRPSRFKLTCLGIGVDDMFNVYRYRCTVDMFSLSCTVDMFRYRCRWYVYSRKRIW